MNKALDRIAAEVAAILAWVWLKVLKRPNRADVVVGWLGKVAVRKRVAGRALERLPSRRMAFLLRSSDSARRCLLRLGWRDVTLTRVLGIAAAEPEAIWFVADLLVARGEDREARGELLHDTVVLSPVASGPGRLAASMLAIPQLAGTLRRDQANDILVRCLEMASQRIGPYEMNPIYARARVVVVSIIQAHPELDDTVGNFARNDANGVALDLFAFALRARARMRWDAFAKMLEQLNPTAEQAREFAENSDARTQAGIRPKAPASRGLTRVGLWFARLNAWAAWMIVPSVSGVVLAAAAVWAWGPLPDFADLLAALAVMGILIAIHVVSAELSANRLPGILARYTATPTVLAATYGGAIGLVAVVVISGTRPTPPATWADNTLLGLTLLFLVIVMYQLIRRTDSATAAERFVDGQAAAYREAGDYLGVIQRRAIRIRAYLASLRYVQFKEPPRTHRRDAIRPRRRGFFLVRTMFVKLMSGLPAWSAGGLTINFSGGLGTIVSSEAEIAAVVPDAHTEVSSIDRALARASIRITRVRRVEEVQEAAAVLIELIVRAADRGDEGSASRIARALVRLLRYHADAAYSARSQESATSVDLAPVIPALRTTAHTAVGQLAAARSPATREALCALLERTLDTSVPSEAYVVMVVSAIKGIGTAGNSAAITRVIRAGAYRALENEDALGLRDVWELLDSRSISKSGDAEFWFFHTAAEIAAMAAWLDYSAAMGAWRRFWRIAARVTAASGPRYRELYACMIGAAALEAGVTSVSLECILDLRASGCNMPGLTATFANPVLLDRLASWSYFGNGYLGDAPKDAIDIFVRFAVRGAQAIK